MRVRVVAGMHELPELPGQRPHAFNFGDNVPRINTAQRPAARARASAAPGPPGGAVDEVPRDPELVSGQPGDGRQRLPVLPGPARTRADHELHPLRSGIDARRSPHARDGTGAGQPLRPFGVSGQRSRRAGRRRRIPAGSVAISGPGESAGTSRAARSSTTGAIPTAFWSSTSPTATCSTTPSNPAGRRSAASGLAQWGPPATKDFLGTDLKSARHELVSMITALRARNEFDISRLIGLLKVPTS